MSMLPDGIYDVFVIDVEEVDDGTTRIELTVTSGAHKTAIVAVRAARAYDDALTIIGLPGTLRVDGGVPTFALDT